MNIGCLRCESDVLYFELLEEMFGRSLHEIDLHHPQFRRSGQPVTSAVVRERPIILTTAMPWANDCDQGCVNHLNGSPFLGHWCHIWFVKTPDRSNLCDVTKFQANRQMSYDWCDAAKLPRRRLNRAWAGLSNKTACSQKWVGWGGGVEVILFLIVRVICWAIRLEALPRLW